MEEVVVVKKKTTKTVKTAKKTITTTKFDNNLGALIGGFIFIALGVVYLLPGLQIEKIWAVILLACGGGLVWSYFKR